MWRGRSRLSRQHDVSPSLTTTVGVEADVHVELRVVGSNLIESDRRLHNRSRRSASLFLA